MLCKTEWLWELWAWSHKMNLLDILSTSPTTSVRNEWRKQMWIQILIKWFKGLRTITFNTSELTCCYWWSKWQAKGGTIKFCEMLLVNLHLLQHLGNLMTGLHVHLLFVTQHGEKMRSTHSQNEAWVRQLLVYPLKFDFLSPF